MKGRVKQLGFDDLIARLRAVAGALPDPRTGDNTQFSMADIALAACSVFFTQCPSFLSCQQNMEQARARNNARSLFQVERIPTDNHIRQTLDSVAPEHLLALFDDLHRAFDELGVPCGPFKTPGSSRWMRRGISPLHPKTFTAPTVPAS